MSTGPGAQQSSLMLELPRLPPKSATALANASASWIEPQSPTPAQHRKAAARRASGIRRYSLASTVIELEAPEARQRSVPVKLILIGMSVVATCLPSVLFWYFMSVAVNGGLRDVHMMGQTSLNGAILALRRSMIHNFSSVFRALTTPAEVASQYTYSRFLALGLNRLNGSNVQQNFSFLTPFLRDMV